MKIIKPLLWAASFCLFIYLVTSFAQASFNIADWREQVRLSAALLATVMVIIICSEV